MVWFLFGLILCGCVAWEMVRRSATDKPQGEIDRTGVSRSHGLKNAVDGPPNSDLVKQSNQPVPLESAQKFSYAFIDLETTGLDPETDRIIEIAVFIMNEGENTQRGETELINPQRHLPERITEITGITDEMLADRKTASQVLPRFLDFIGDRKIFAYNAEFDMGFLRAEAHRIGRTVKNPSFCVLQQVQAKYPELQSHRLGDVCEAFNIKTDKKLHRAAGDAERTMGVYIAVCRNEVPLRVYTRQSISSPLEIVERSRNRLLLKVPQVRHDVLEMCIVGHGISTWAKPDTGDIFMFAPGSGGGSGRITVVSKSHSPEIIEVLEKFPYISVKSVEGASLIIECLTPNDFSVSYSSYVDESRLGFRSKQTVSVAILCIDEPEPNTGSPTGAIAVRLAEFVLPSGNLVRTGDSFDCTFSRTDKTASNDQGQIYQSAGRSISKLEKLFDQVDVVVAHGVYDHALCLSRMMPNGRLDKVHLWGCTMTMFSRLAKIDKASLADVCGKYTVPLSSPDNAASRCDSVINLLLNHTGKTARSRTFAASLLLDCKYAISSW